MSQLFAHKLKSGVQTSLTAETMEKVKLFTKEQKSEVAALGTAISTESISEVQAADLQRAVDSWVSSFESIANELGLKDFKRSMAESAAAAMAYSSDLHSFMSTPIHVTGNSTANSTFVGMEGLDDATTTRQIVIDNQAYSLEAYDERDNKNAVANMVTYNFQAGRQNDFGELFFPTVTITNDNHGIKVTINLINVYNDTKHEVTGALYNWQKRNIVKAFIDGTILKNEMTRLIPVFRAGQNQDNFVDNAYMAPYTVVNEGMSINTAPLKVGRTMNLIGLCQTDAALANGTADSSDSIDPMVEVGAIYLKLQNDKIRIPVTGIAGNNFVQTGVDLDRAQRLYMSTNGIVLNKNTKNVDGSALTDLAGIATNDLVVYLKVLATGQINVEQGDLVVYAPEVKIDRVYDTTTGQEIALSAAPASALVTAFADAEIVGYDIYGYLTNANLRNRGQLLTTNEYSQVWSVPLRSPVTMIKPTQAPVQDDNANLNALIVATVARTSNEAVRTLLKTSDMLRSFVDNRLARPESDYLKMPSLFGVARFLLEPAYIEEELDVMAAINSIKSHEQAKDVAAVLVQRIRDIAYRLYRDSGFQAVVDSQAAGIQGMPTVLVGTDITIARYLIIDGESRMAGPSFDYRVVVTPDQLMQNRIFIAFGYPDMNQGQLNPLHFGNMFWAPEMVVKLPISRGGQTSNEMIVQPRFRHIVNVPVLGQIKVKKLMESAINKITVNTHNV